ncbi:MAG: glutamate racemase [Betaproteobacteria bacterium]
MIGVYDSGIGGLSILQALRQELPEQDFIYLADSGHGPYGERDSGHVVERAHRITDHLRGRGIQALVVACNTATAAAIEQLRSEHPDLPIIGVEPALKPALALSRSRHIGVLATRMTLASDKFARLLEPLRQQADFVLRACDGLALAIENSVQGSAQAQADLHACASEHVHALGELGAGSGQIDTLVLGCTHYPFIASQLQALAGPQVSLVDTGAPVARQTRSRLAELAAPAPSGSGRIELISTGPSEGLQAAAQRWLAPELRAAAVDLP